MSNSHIENLANAIVSKIISLIGTHNEDSSAHSNLFSGKSDTGHTHTKSNITDFPTSMTPTGHASTAGTYGLGNATMYGHVKTINKLSTSSYVSGEALSAYQGYLLNQNKADAGHTHTEYLTSHQDISGKEDKSNKSSSITADTGSTTKYPSVKAVEDALSSIFRYELTSSSYNPDINGSFTITCKVTDIYGNPVSNKSVTLLENGGRLYDGNAVDCSNNITNSNGEATWTISCDNIYSGLSKHWGLRDYSVEDAHCQIRVIGWKYVAGTSSSSYRFMRNETHARMVLHGWSRSSTITTSFSNFGDGTYAQTIRPIDNVTGYLGSSVLVNISDMGVVKIKSATGSSIASNTAIYGQFEWSIRDADL